MIEHRLLSRYVVTVQVLIEYFSAFFGDFRESLLVRLGVPVPEVRPAGHKDDCNKKSHRPGHSAFHRVIVEHISPKLNRNLQPKTNECPARGAYSFPRPRVQLDTTFAASICSSLRFIVRT